MEDKPPKRITSKKEPTCEFTEQQIHHMEFIRERYSTTDNKNRFFPLEPIENLAQLLDTLAEE